jgi:hypothetical protein
MNERFKTLMGKTLDEKFSETWTSMSYQDLEKFSESLSNLIVRECIEIANTVSVEQSDIDKCCDEENISYFQGNNNAVNDVINLIKQYFGVVE